jgi:UPF0755 protein
MIQHLKSQISNLKKYVLHTYEYAHDWARQIFVQHTQVPKKELSEPSTEEQHERTNKRGRAIVLLCLLVGAWIYVDIVRAPTAFPVGELVTIESGTPLSTISHSLQDAKVVRSSFALNLLVRLYGTHDSVKAGDYLFKEPKNLFAIARIISVGAFGLEPVAIRIPEGADTDDMAAIFKKRLLRFNPDTFIELARPHEGFLFPDTYYFMPNVREADIVTVMSDNFTQKVAPLLPEIEASGSTLEQIVTMASIIEKEASRDADRRKISGVLWHRLDIGMPLQVDATFVYTHNKGSYGITLAELQDETNPYNTYVHKGLPPGPIASPGFASIVAALEPVETKALFYLADRKGNTYFSETYAEHLRKKVLYVD